MNQVQQIVLGPEKMTQLGLQLSQLIKPPFLWYLKGDLGAGKTTLVRSFLQGMGHKGSVKSPTYTLVEPYEFDDIDVFHFDFYRLSQPQELAAIGWRDYLTSKSICVVEWPERAGDWLPQPDILCEIIIEEDRRKLLWEAYTPSGEVVLQQLPIKK